MKTIYLDSNYMCHINNNGTWQEITTDIFDSMKGFLDNKKRLIRI